MFDAQTSLPINGLIIEDFAFNAIRTTDENGLLTISDSVVSNVAANALPLFQTMGSIYVTNSLFTDITSTANIFDAQHPSDATSIHREFMFIDSSFINIHSDGAMLYVHNSYINDVKFVYVHQNQFSIKGDKHNTD